MAHAFRALLDAGSLLTSSGSSRGRRRWLASSLVAASLVGCGGMLAEPAPQVETAALHDGAGDAVIATLHTKDSELKVMSAGGRVRYSLLDRQGISKSLTLEEIGRHDPNLYEFVKAALARRGGPVLDARIDSRPEPLPVTTERLEAGRHLVAPPSR